MLELLTEMLSVHGPSGFEAPVREAVRRRVKGIGQQSVDHLGNLVVTLGRGTPHVAVVAHMDELGFVITRIDEAGRLKFKKIGAIDDRMLPGSEVLVLGQYGPVVGVIGIKPPHLTTDPAELKQPVNHENLFIDVGASNPGDVEAMGVSVTSPAVFEKRLRRMAHNIVSSRAIDNRYGISALIKMTHALKGRKLKGSLTLIWSVQEEFGLRGSSAAAHTLRPDYMLALDTCSATDIPGVPQVFSPLSVGGGPLLRLMDARCIASPELRTLAEEVAKAKRITLQYGISGGSTDAVEMQAVGCAVMPVGVPVRYTHSKVECASLDDMEQSVALAQGMVERLLR